MQTYLIYPQLFLFAYDRQVPGSEGGNGKDWDALRDRLQIHPEANQPGDRDYLFRNPDGQGFYLRYGVGDTQSLMVALMPHSDETCDITLLSGFRHTLDVSANLGKTWLILGYVNSRSDAVHFQAAHAAYQGFYPSKSVPAFHPSKLLNCSLFEVRESPQDWQNSDQELEVIIICICPSKSALKRVADLYFEWLWLFLDRHQIWSAYRTSQLIQKALEEQGIFRSCSILPELPELMRSSPAISLQNLSNLQSQLAQNLGTLAQHRAGLEALETQRHTLSSHLRDYEKRLQRIQEQLQEEMATSDLKVWVEFRDYIAPQYQGELEQQWRGFKMGLLRREQSLQEIAAVLKRAEIKERDRRLENAIAAAAMGVGTTTASAISLTQALSKLSPPASRDEFTPTQLGLNYGLVLLVSIFLGILCAGVSWRGLNRWRSPQ
ncbi:hypothetical protein [Laspinema olomoucense]|uniref:Uncharacterized protein n=1 Tax=Laspinema olomoucense D3b TaxID=2953688 RepID=A0ABT2NDB6_9CYAN|nr:MULTISPECIES: hypothetical protein [unclassified Laspinema]MCT7980695.1 hypothetical protein [Laspinema sp. D3b]MCT7991244.1 hypothetical protein [Laspinema sp. D3a]